jgi:hypothetical protein
MSDPVTPTMYAGGTLNLGSNLFSGTTVSGGSLDATCYITSTFEVKKTVGGVDSWVDSSDAYFGKIITSTAGPTSNTSKSSSISLLADASTFNAGSTTDSTLVSIRVSYALPQQVAVSKTIVVTILPKSKLV